VIDFGRTIRIRIGPSGSKGRDFLSTQSGGGPRLNFKASRTSAREPNTLTAKLYNLAPESRAFIEREGASVVVDAGYGKRVSTFFAGDVARAWSARENGVDWVTNIEGGDGEFLFRDAKFSRSFAVGTSSDVIFGSIAGAFGLPLGFVSPRGEGRNQRGGCRRARREPYGSACPDRGKRGSSGRSAPAEAQQSLQAGADSRREAPRFRWTLPSD